MQPHIGYGLILKTEGYLEVIRQHEERSTLASLAKKLLRDFGEKLTPERQEKLTKNLNEFFLHDLNVLEYFSELEVTSMNGLKYVFIGYHEQFNSRWQKPDIFYKVDDIFSKEQQRKLREKLEEYGFSAKKCQFYFGLTVINDMKPFEEED